MEQNDSRDQILAEALAAIEKARNIGGHIAVGDIAASFLERFPNLSISLPALESDIARLAVAHGIKNIEFGPSGPGENST